MGPNTKLKWVIRAANDGLQQDKIRLIGGPIPALYAPDYTLKFVSDGKNVTTQVLSGDFKTAKLDNGEYQDIKAKIKGGAGAGGSDVYFVPVMLVSTKGGPIVDVVRIGVENL